MEVDVANPKKKKKFINQREICHTSWVILVTVAWSVVRTWIRSNNLNTSCKERSPEFKKNPKKKNPMPQLRVTQLCNNNEKLKKFTFFPFSEEIKLQQKAHTFHNNMLHIWEDNDTLFTQNSCKLPAQHNYKWCSPSKLKISIEMKESDREKRVRSYRRVESLMEPFRWACNSTFGIDANHSIFVCGILFFFPFSQHVCLWILFQFLILLFAFLTRSSRLK